MERTQARRAGLSVPVEGPPREAARERREEEIRRDKYTNNEEKKVKKYREGRRARI